SVLWFFGEDIPGIPNKRAGGYCFGGKIAPIFFNTMEDAGALPIEMDVSQMHMGDVIDVYPYAGIVKRHGTEEVISTFSLKTPVLLDEVRAGGRINLIIGRGLTNKARESLGLPPTDLFRTPEQPADTGKGFTLAQKMVGKACGMAGVRPGMYCEPKMTTVGSQDTTGPMTRDELKDLACLGFSADLVMQSFCHTAAYPKPVDVVTHHTLPDFIMTRGGVSLRPGDGVIHSWLNRMLLPDTVGTGGDSHTRFPLGISLTPHSRFAAVRVRLLDRRRTWRFPLRLWCGGRSRRPRGLRGHTRSPPKQKPGLSRDRVLRVGRAWVRAKTLVTVGAVAVAVRFVAVIVRLVAVAVTVGVGRRVIRLVAVAPVIPGGSGGRRQCGNGERGGSGEAENGVADHGEVPFV
ncbi:MAG: hypothetical protein ACK4RS_04630, partial [Thiothrix sp.]